MTLINRHITATLILLLLSLAATAQQVTFKGRVTNEKGSPVEIATVSIQGTATGTVTDLKGNYRLNCESRDTMIIVFSMIGHQTRKRTFHNPTDTITLNITLPTTGYSLEGVEITDEEKQMGGTQKISVPKNIRLNASASGNAIEDIISTQAGVSSHNELSSQYNVRGGNFDENSVYVNGIEIYRPLLIRAGQQEGLSFLNPDMVETIAFSTGGFEAKYGDKMSSVLDITYRKPREFESVITAGLLGSSAYIGVGNEKFSFANSVRYKSSKNLLKSLETKGEYEPKFIDYQAYFDWRITKKLSLSFIGNVSSNEYKFTPEDRNTSFGTLQDVKEFKVYFDGWESDLFTTLFGATALNFTPNEYNTFTLQASAFKTKEEETYDISSEYWIGDIYAEENYGVGRYQEHGRNYLEADVQTIALKGSHFLKAHDLRWGVEWKKEKFNDNQREWQVRDSAGYNIPHGGEYMQPIYSLRSRNSESSNRYSAYVQDTYKFKSKLGVFSLNGGVRLSYWGWNKELLVSPRASLGLIPEFNKNLTLRIAAGIYYQAPFYKEMRDTVSTNGITEVVLNKDIKSPRSIQLVIGSDYYFTMLGRPFKFTAEAYYKKLSNIIPYNVDNVRIVYYGENCAKGHALGIDFKLFGEFVKGADSWVTFSVMDTKESINGGKKIPRPTNQKFNFSLHFTDYFPGTDKWKMTLRGVYADGLPFGPPHKGREGQVFTAPAYKRVDVGMSYRLLDNEDNRYRTGIRRHIKNIWLGIDAFNLFDMNNVNSYYWISDMQNQQYAVPNYLTGRLINGKIVVEL